MRKTTIALMTLAFVALGLAASADERGSESRKGRALTFSPIDVPGATVSNATGINSRGDIVGSFADGSGIHGYLLSEGVLTKIDYPGAAYTDARGINARGDIVGAYRLLGEPAVNLHGYLRTKDGEYIAVDVPGHTNTVAQRITRSGLIVGCRHDTDTMSTMRGVMINAHDPNEFHEIDQFASMNNGATPDGSLIVGLYTDMATGRGRGYLLYGDTFIPFDVPGSIFTAAWDVNPGGKVVGVYRDATGFHGFLWADLRFQAINYPAATATRAFGINSRGDIVGNYVDATGRTHGFLASKTEEHDR